MKKTFFVLVGLSVLSASILFSSCKSHEKCPAYSKINTDNSYAKVRSV